MFCVSNGIYLFFKSVDKQLDEFHTVLSAIIKSTTIITRNQMALSIDAHTVQRFDVAIVSNYSCQMKKNQMKKKKEIRFVIEAFQIYFGGRVNRKHNRAK